MLSGTSKSILEHAPLVALDAFAVLLVVAALPLAPQDFLPFFTAADLVVDGQWTTVMLPETATHLMDSAPLFVERSQALGGLEPAYITGFVAPPASLVLVAPLLSLPFTWAATVWRMVFAGIWIASFHALDAEIRARVPDQRLAWSLVLVSLLPAVIYTGALGQTSPLLFAAVIAGIRAMRTGDPRVAGVLVGLAGVFKLGPLGVLPFLPRRAWLPAAGVAGGLSLLSVLLFPWELWPAFFASSANLGSHVMAMTGNVAAAAVGQRLVTGEAVPFLQAPTAVSLGLGWGLRLATLAAAVFVNWRRPHSLAGWSCAWVAVLALSPLLWIHYLPLLPLLFLGWRVFWPVCIGLAVALANFGVLKQSLNLHEGEVGGAVWLFAATVLVIAGVREALSAD